MNKSVLYIVGAVALLGGGAFLFLRNKKKKDAIKLAEIEQKTQTLSSTPVAPAPAPAPAPAVTSGNTLDSAKEIEANGLATQIFGLKSRKSLFSVMDSPSFTVKLQIASVTSQINALTKKLKALGYKEVNGKAVKL
jgi:LPXTG-motif cell wall-anchored protein